MQIIEAQEKISYNNFCMHMNNEKNDDIEIFHIGACLCSDHVLMDRENPSAHT